MYFLSAESNVRYYAEEGQLFHENAQKSCLVLWTQQELGTAEPSIPLPTLLLNGSNEFPQQDLVYHNYQCHRDKYQSRTKNSMFFFFPPNCSSSKATLAVINRLWNNQFLTHQMRSQCHFYQDIWSLPASPMLTHPPQIAVFQGQYILKKEHWLSRDQKITKATYWTHSLINSWGQKV